MLGAVGAYAWSGTVVHQKGSVATIFPFSAFEGTLQERNHSSLLGMLLRFLLPHSPNCEYLLYHIMVLLHFSLHI